VFDVIKTRRLGIGNASNKPRFLLVILRGIDQAQRLIPLARLLRRSANPAIRCRVYINPNLTTAEDEAAYLLREKRHLSCNDLIALMPGSNLTDHCTRSLARQSDGCRNHIAESRCCRWKLPESAGEPVYTGECISAFCFILTIEQQAFSCRPAIRPDLSCLLFNACSLNRKLQELNSLRHSEQLDILCITKSWLHVSIDDSIILNGIAIIH
jgi:hypothetical protein